MIKYFQWDESKIMFFNIAYFLSLLSLFWPIGFCLKLILVSTDIDPVLNFLDLHMTYTWNIQWKLIIYILIKNIAKSFFIWTRLVMQTHDFVVHRTSTFQNVILKLNHAINIYTIFQNVSIFLGLIS